MTNVTWRTPQVTAAAIAGLGFFMIDDVAPTTSGLFATKAHAVIGRPATSMSYAGVARRTTRRVYGAAAYGAAVAVPAYGTPGGCVQVVDAYGRLVTQCYGIYDDSVRADRVLARTTKMSESSSRPSMSKEHRANIWRRTPVQFR